MDSSYIFLAIKTTSLRGHGLRAQGVSLTQRFYCTNLVFCTQLRHSWCPDPWPLFPVPRSQWFPVERLPVWNLYTSWRRILGIGHLRPVYVWSAWPWQFSAPLGPGLGYPGNQKYFVTPYHLKWYHCQVITHFTKSIHLYLLSKISAFSSIVIYNTSYYSMLYRYMYRCCSQFVT